MINGISGINGITYSPNELSQSNNFLNFFNQAIEMGYDPAEAKKWANKKVKEQKEKRNKNRKTESLNKSDQSKHIIDRRA